MVYRLFIRSSALLQLLLLGGVLAGCSTSQTISMSGPAMSLGAPAAPPAAYLDFCLRMPSECGVNPTEADASQVISRRYWRAVLAAAQSPSGRGFDWARISQAIDEAPAAIHASTVTATASPTSSTISAARPMGRPIDLGDSDIGDNSYALNPFIDDAATDPVHDTFEAGLAAAAADTPRPETPVPESDRPGVPPIAQKLPWTAETRALITGVNAEINHAIKEQPDIITYGVDDYWAIPTLRGKDHYGDCEDYALTKRQRLIAAGIPSEALSIAIVRTRANTVHAVLLVSTDHGDFVLDNLDPGIRAWTETTYRWIERQVPGSAFAWARPGPPVVPSMPTIVRRIVEVQLADSTPAAASGPPAPTSISASASGEVGIASSGASAER